MGCEIRVGKNGEELHRNSALAKDLVAEVVHLLA
jgi:hypothetical protein